MPLLIVSHIEETALISLNDCSCMLGIFLCKMLQNAGNEQRNTSFKTMILRCANCSSLVTSTISSCLWNKQSLPLKKHLWKPPSCSYLPSTQIFLVHFRLHYKLLHQTLSTHIHPHNCFLSGSVPKYFFLFLALWTWWWLVRAHQLVWKEILLQLQDRGVPVGEAQRMAGEVAIPKPRGSTHLILISVT